MPITPLHFGPAIAGKAVAPKCFSVLAFGFTQVIIYADAGFYLEIISKLAAAPNALFPRRHPSFPRRRESIGLGQRHEETSETDLF